MVCFKAAEYTYYIGKQNEYSTLLLCQFCKEVEYVQQEKRKAFSKQSIKQKGKKSAKRDDKVEEIS